MAMTLKRSASFISFFISSWKLLAQTSWMCVSGMLRISCVPHPYSSESHSASVSQLVFCILNTISPSHSHFHSHP